MLRGFRVVSALLLTGSCLAACGAVRDSGAQGGWTRGTEGRLEFSFDTESPEDGLEPGTVVEVFVTGPGADDVIDVASVDTAVATFDVDRACSCGAESDGRYEIRSISATAACRRDEVKACQNRVTAHAHSVGETELLVLDAAREVLDRAPVRVREAKSGD